jgi:hypothetical protein
MGVANSLLDEVGYADIAYSDNATYPVSSTKSSSIPVSTYRSIPQGKRSKAGNS